MKCLSIWQPWASLLAHGVKRVESRGWDTRYRGPILIHAAKHWDRALRDYVLRDACVQVALSRIDIALLDGGWSHRVHTNARGVSVDRPKLPFGAIVGRCVLESTWPAEQVTFTPETPNPVHGMLGGVQIGDTERGLGDYGPGRYAWCMRDIRLFSVPVPFTGRQGLFSVDVDQLPKECR